MGYQKLFQETIRDFPRDFEGLNEETKTRLRELITLEGGFQETIKSIEAKKGEMDNALYDEAERIYADILKAREAIRNKEQFSSSDLTALKQKMEGFLTKLRALPDRGK